MDQLRTFLAGAKQHAFWVMCSLILIVSIGSWWYSTSQLDQDREAQSSKIKGVASKLTSIQSSNPLHPNEATHKGMDAMIATYGQEVAAGWAAQYERQESILVWPEKFGEDFKAAVNDLRPIEKLTYPTPIRDEIEVAYRRVYRNFIEEELPALAEIIGTKFLASSAASGSGASGGGYGGYQPMPMSSEGGYPGGPNAMNEPVDTSIVAWPQARQQELFDTHFGFCASPEPPTTLQVLYAQEDIWVLTSIMNIIAATNEGAEARHDAAIKEIDFIRMGRNALGFAGQVTPVGTPKSTGTMGAEGSPASTDTTGGPGATYPSEGGSGYPGAEGAGALGDPAEGRYVDGQFKPLPASKLREALTSENPEDALLAVAKRMPVRMRFYMDQRKLNRLLAECGNATLPLEVRQVRVNREAAQPGGTTSGYGGGGSSYGGYPGGSGYPGAMGGSQGMSEYGGMPGASGARNLIADGTIDSNLIPIEIYGVVYIYNPVNKTQLGIQEEEAPPPTTADSSSPELPVTPTAAPAAPATVN